MSNNKYSKEQKEQIIKLREEQQKDFSEICKIMKLSQRKARSLYHTTQLERKKK